MGEPVLEARDNTKSSSKVRKKKEKNSLGIFCTVLPFYFEKVYASCLYQWWLMTVSCWRVVLCGVEWRIVSVLFQKTKGPFRKRRSCDVAAQCGR
jgi:hypothetical protein